MPYEFEAFFSYKRDLESNGWHERVKDKLTHWLKQELGKDDVRIFFDTEDIHIGVRWRQKIADALKGSKCIICVWSPLYFQSKWCVSEWKTFLQREQLAGRNLVAPASYFDGETFPPEAAAIEYEDFSPFASTMPRFWDTESAVKFEDSKIRPFARDLARMITQAPPYDATFPIVEALDAQVQKEETIGRISDV